MPGRIPSDSRDATSRQGGGLSPGPGAVVLGSDDVDGWCEALSRAALQASMDADARGHLCLPCADPDALRDTLRQTLQHRMAMHLIGDGAGPPGLGDADPAQRLDHWGRALLAGWPPTLPGLHRIELEPARWLVTVLVRVPSATLARIDSGFSAARVRSVLVVGAGLAGCAVADALLRRGLSVQVVEATSRPGGVVDGLPWLAQHPAVSPDRRSALLLQALLTTDRLRDRLSTVFNACGRLQPMLGDEADRRAAAVPAGIATVQPVACGVRGLWFERAAVANPAAWWRLLAERDGVVPRFDGRIDRLLPGAQGGWQALDERGRTLAITDAVVLANAEDAFRLARMPTIASGPLRRRRLAVRVARAIGPDGLPRASATPPLLRPVRGGLAGTAGGTGAAGMTQPFRIEEPGVCCILGPQDVDGDVDADGTPEGQGERPQLDWPGVTIRWSTVQGGARLQLRDHLPMAGPVPDCAAVLADRDRFERDARIPLPCIDNLYLLTGLGGRGLLWSVIGAERIAAAICGEPPPLSPDLLAAIAPDRFLVRTLRRTRRGRGALPVSVALNVAPHAHEHDHVPESPDP